MPGYVPTHREECQTTTRPWRCKFCGRKIFLFTCTCDSIVYFNSLGGEWPEHNCPERQFAERDARRNARANLHVIPNIDYVEVNVEVTGITWDINFFDILGFPENPISWAFLEEAMGTLITDAQVRVDIDVLETTESRLLRRERFYMPLERAEQIRLQIGRQYRVGLFLMVLRFTRPPTPIWVMSEIREI